MDLTQFDTSPTPQRNWSEFQLAIFDHLPSEDNLIIEAVAGSGKTSTILECMNRSAGASLFLAFNKAIADDLRSKVNGAEVRTLNALGHSIVTKRLPGVRLESWKTANLVRSLLNTEEYVAFGPSVTRLISLAKGCAFGILNSASRSDFIVLADEFELDIPFEYMAKATQVAKRAFDALIEDFTSFDFDDQLFLPIYHEWNFPSYDTVFVDEAQDLNAIQHLMLDRLRNNGARIVAVGDTRQAIYGFRGASHSSMSLLRKHFSMKELPLSITYRCDSRIVELAQTIVPSILPRPNAGLGEVLYTSELDVMKIPDDTLVVCRNNRPLFSLAMQALKARRPVRVMSNFTDQLKSFIKAFKTRDLSILASRLQKWYEGEMKQAEENEFFGRMAYTTDKYETVLSLIEESTTLDDILNALERFSNSREGPVLATIHKAKGLEAERTIILNRNLLPSRFARSEAALVQEDNLLYVAITRAKHSLLIHEEMP